MKRVFSILFALALVLGFSLVVTAPVAAATPIYVDATRPDDTGDGTSWATAKKTIQAGINVVDVGGTVYIAAGTYAEKVVVNKANLILSGPNAGVNPNTGTRGAEAVIQPTAAPTWPTEGAVNIMAAGATFDGFEVDASHMPNVASADGSIVINIYGASDVTVRNNIAHGATAGDWQGTGIVAWDWDSAYTVDRATIENNKVYDIGRMGIFCMDYDTTNDKYDLTEGHIIRGNTVYDTWLKGNDWGDAGGGIQINVGKDCIIEGNEVFNTASATSYTTFDPGI